MKKKKKGPRLFQSLIQKNDDTWMELSPKDMYHFLSYCIRMQNMVWVSKVRVTVRKRLEDKGYIHNNVLGWVYPEELKQAGVGEDSIHDIDKFHSYLEYKKSVATEDWKTEAKLSHEKNHQDYLDQVVKDDDQATEGNST